MTGRLLITGGGRGIGRATALLAAKSGWDVDLLGRPSAGMRRTRSEIIDLGRTARVFACDLARRDQVDAALRELVSDEVPDVLIHNAGCIERAELVAQSDELWDTTFEVNVSAPMRITRALLPSMLERGSGRVLFVSSISAVVGTPRQSAYNASKAAMVGLMRCLAEELAGGPVMTLALLPGAVDTDMLSGSGFPPRMSAEDVARSLLFFSKQAPRAHHGAVIEMYG